MQSMENALTELKNIPEGEKPYDLFVMSLSDLANQAVCDMVEEVEVPIVAYAREGENSEGQSMGTSETPTKLSVWHVMAHNAREFLFNTKDSLCSPTAHPSFGAPVA